MPKSHEHLTNFVGVDALAEELGVTPDTVYRWGYEEGMPYHQAAGPKSRWFIDVDEFDQWLRSRCSSNAAVGS
jgi:hypothetical protein